MAGERGVSARRHPVAFQDLRVSRGPRRPLPPWLTPAPFIPHSRRGDYIRLINIMESGRDDTRPQLNYFNPL